MTNLCTPQKLKKYARDITSTALTLSKNFQEFKDQLADYKVCFFESDQNIPWVIFDGTQYLLTNLWLEKIFRDIRQKRWLIVTQNLVRLRSINPIID